LEWSSFGEIQWETLFLFNDMEFWIFFQIAVDIILLVIIFFYFIRDRKKQTTPFQEIDEDRVRALLDSFNQMMQESKSILDEIYEGLDKEKNSLQQMEERLEFKKGEMGKSIEAADRFLIRLQEITDKDIIKSETGHDKYEQAIKLAREGLNDDEIAEAVELPKGEVELILNLKKE